MIAIKNWSLKTDYCSLNIPITVAVVEDNHNLRQGTSYILRAAPNCSVAGEYENAEELLKEFDDIRPDVMLMDIGLPGMLGIEATAKLKSKYPHLQIVILSVFEDDENVFHAVCAGACGYIAKPVMALGGTLEYFRGTVFNYPTLAEAYKVAALNGMNKL